MPPVVDSHSTYSCTTIRFVTDARRDISVPIGVVLWSSDGSYLRFRMLGPDEKVPGVNLAEAAPYLGLAEAKIRHWIEKQELPYADRSLPLLSEGWWGHVAKLLRFRVRVDPVRPIDCRRPDDEIQPLFDALVKPKATSKQRATRVDGLVSKALGPRLVTRFPRAQSPIPAYRDTRAAVLRVASDARKVVIVDAVSLASATAVHDADALASRVLRIKAGPHGAGARFVLGYVASPNGLNGENGMKEWIEEKAAVRMYDLIYEDEQFRAEAAGAVASVDDPMGLLQDTNGD